MRSPKILALNLLIFLKIYIIEAILFIKLVKDSRIKLFAIIITNIEKTLKEKKYLNSIIFLLLEYYNFLNVFFRKDINKLFLYRSNNYTIELKLDIKSSYDSNILRRVKDIKKIFK